MAFRDRNSESTYSKSFTARTLISYQTNAQKSGSFLDLRTGCATSRAEYVCEVFYNGRVKIWNTIGNHRFTVDYEPKQIVFESLKKCSAGGEWVWLDPRYDSWTPSVQDKPDIQLILGILSKLPTTDLVRENDAQRHSLITAAAFPLACLHKTFTRVKLALFDAARDHDWNPEFIISLITRPQPKTSHMEANEQDQDVVMRDAAKPSEKLDMRMLAFLDREEAAMKAERVDGEVITAGVKAMRSASLTPASITGYRLPLIPIFVGQGEAVKETVPLAERGHAVDFSHFEEINPSQRSAVQHAFDYQVSLIHAPTGCGPIATIIYATEAILRKAPRSRILICSISNTVADKVAEGFRTREHLCNFRFKYLRFLPRMTDDLKDIRVIICTYAASGVDRLANAWFPQILIGDDAGRLRHYELIVPLATHLDSLNRLVLLGDHIQLGPLASTHEAQEAWAESIFEKMMKERWPQQMLCVNYWTHPDLCYPTSLVFYRNLVTAARDGAEPTSFLTQLLRGNMPNLQINDQDGGTAKLESRAHFFDIRTQQGGTIEPEVSCIDNIVRALLSTGGCKTNELILIHGSREYHDLLSSKAKSNGWSGVAIENVASVQGLSWKIVIICLSRWTLTLENSPLSQQRAVSVMMSLATDMCLVVGNWKSVCELSHTNDLQRVLFCMDERIEKFLLRLGDEPYSYGAKAPTTLNE